ncbi:hypothetical protein ABVV53_09970 [Novosphingobium sp. RD2P27]|uniref:Uncharacterized protein n=1 Tax=Novosphingobium kalidii TaxID=3230299 RepID=A0ABV2D1N6_9SPHN
MLVLLGAAPVAARISPASQTPLIVRQASKAARRIETVNLRNFQKIAGGDATLVLAPGDVVFVFSTTIAEVSRFIDQYVNNALSDLFHLDVSFGNGNTIRPVSFR